MVLGQNGPQDDLAATLSKLRQDVDGLLKRDVLQNASIGAGGITVSGGGSIRVVGGGSISLDTGTFVASTINGTTINTGTNFNAPSGTLVSAYARSHSVVTGYVAAYIDSGGNFLSTPSSARMKRDVETQGWTREQRDAIRVVTYRLRAAYILATMAGDDPDTVERLVGVIGEEILAIGGFEEFVVLDSKQRVFSVRYELLALIALDGLQQAEARQDATDKEVRDLRQEVTDLRAVVEAL